MIRATLTRLETGDQGTFGKLECGEFHCFTLELPWRDNEKDISCIPVGVYKCFFTTSPRFKKRMYEITNVPRRTGVRIHAANMAGDKSLGFYSHLNGCVALGEKIGFIDRQKALLVSVSAVRKFEEYLNEKPFELEVKNV